MLAPTPLQAQEPITIGILDVNDETFPDVRVIVTIVEPGGRPLRGLTSGSFSAQESGAAANVSRVETVLNEQIGVAAILTIDTSGSMFGTALTQSKAAAAGFVRGLQSADQVAVISFASQVVIQNGLTSNRGSTLAAIDSLAARGDTSLYNAVIESISVARSAPLPRKAVILLSDGVDVGGTATRDQALSAAADARIPMYVIGLGSAIDRGFLSELAQRTGGAFFETPTPDGIVGLYDQLTQLLRSQYVVTLRSSARADIESRSLSLMVRTSSGSFQAQIDYQTRRTIVPTVLTEVPPTTIQAPTAEEGSLPTAILLGVLGAVAIVGSLAFVYSRMRDRHLGTAIEELSLKARNELKRSGGVVTEAMTTHYQDSAIGRTVFLLVKGPGDDQRRFRVSDEPATIGSAQTSQLRLIANAGNIAPEHARISLMDGKLMFHQVAKEGQSLVAGKPVNWVTLENGDEIEIGSYKLSVEMTESGP